jgi:hypothetical protein
VELKRVRGITSLRKLVRKMIKKLETTILEMNYPLIVT